MAVSSAFPSYYEIEPESELEGLVRQTRQNNQFDANAYANRGPRGQEQFGGGANFKNNDFNAGLNAEHNRGFGTDLKAQANGNIWKSDSDRTSVQGSGNFQQHFGGPQGRQQPSYGGSVNLRHQW